LSGPDRSATPELDLNFKAAREISSEWSVGLEHYAGLGRVNKMPNSSQQDQVLYFATDFERKGFGVNFGIGKGLTNVSDDWVVKAIVGFPLN